MLRKALVALALVPALAGVAAAAARDGPGPWGVTVFGGVLLDNTFEEVLFQPWLIDTESARLLGAAGSVRVAEPVDGLEIGLEAQLVRHLGEQSHWEVNAPIVAARWTRFPWRDRLATGVAFGLGLSVASETPELEAANEGGSQPMMAYWMIEVGVGTPDARWELVGRLHHRSTAFGTFGEVGGANALVLGLRRRF